MVTFTLQPSYFKAYKKILDQEKFQTIIFLDFTYFSTFFPTSGLQVISGGAIIIFILRFVQLYIYN